MPTSQLIFRCLIISPSDVEAERDALEDVIAEWNAHIGPKLGARVEAVRWETHSTPAMGGRPQTILNAQLVDTCDLGVAVFWSRLGTPTGTHESGSVEEIERLLGRNARVMVYFSNAPVPQAAMKDEQFARLQKVRERYESKGLLGSYTEVARLARAFQLHLTSTMTTLLLQAEKSTQPLPATGTATAPRPDVRVKVSRAYAFPPPGTSHREVLEVKAENHSPVDFFLASFVFQLEDGSVMFPQKDPLTGQFNSARTIRPGDSYEFHVDPQQLLSDTPAGNRLTYGVARDKIGREFRSPDGDLERILYPGNG